MWCDVVGCVVLQGWRVLCCVVDRRIACVVVCCLVYVEEVACAVKPTSLCHNSSIPHELLRVVYYSSSPFFSLVYKYLICFSYSFQFIFRHSLICCSSLCGV